MLTRALQQTSDQITDKLSREIRELRQRTAHLEQKFDDIEILTHNHSEELETLREENLTLQTRLKDFENRGRRLNVCISGLPETIIDVQSTFTPLFQELAPAIPIECLEMDRVHRALTPRQTDGRPRDIVTKLHYFQTKEQLLAAASN